MNERRAATAIVLAGGGSERMGADKATLELAGRTLLSRSVESVALVCDEVIVAGGRPGLAIGLGADVRWVADAPGAEGPLAGLSAGLEAASHDACLAVACDMPFLSPPLLRLLLARLDGYEAVIPVAGGVRQHLHAAYSRRALAAAQRLLAGSARALHELADQLKVRSLPEDECRRYDPEGLSFFGLNTPADLEFARRRLAAGRALSA